MAELNAYQDFEVFALEVVGRCLIENARKGIPDPMMNVATEVTDALLESREMIRTSTQSEG